MRVVTKLSLFAVASLIVCSSGCFDQPLLVDPIDIDPTDGVINFNVAGNTISGADGYMRDDFSGVLREAVVHYEKNGSQKQSGQKNNMTIEYDLNSGLRIKIKLDSKQASLYIDGEPADLQTCYHDKPPEEGGCTGNGIPAKITGPFRGALSATYKQFFGNSVTRKATKINLN